MSNMKENDYGVIIERTLVDEDGDAIDVTTATSIRLDVEDEDGELYANYTGSLTGPGTNGKVRYVTQSGDFPAGSAGHYQAQFVVKIGGYVYRSDRFHFEVDPSIDSDNP